MTEVRVVPEFNEDGIRITNWMVESLEKGSKASLPQTAVDRLGGINYRQPIDLEDYELEQTPLSTAVDEFIANVRGFPNKQHKNPYLPTTFQILLQTLGADPNIPQKKSSFGDPVEVEYIYPLDSILNHLQKLDQKGKSTTFTHDAEWLAPLASILIEYGATATVPIPTKLLKLPKWENLRWQQSVTAGEEYAPGGKRYRAVQEEFLGGQLEQARLSLSQNCQNLQDEYNLPQLKEIAKLVGLSGYSHKNKADLCQELAIVMGQRGNGYDGVKASTYRRRVGKSALRKVSKTRKSGKKYSSKTSRTKKSATKKSVSKRSRTNKSATKKSVSKRSRTKKSATKKRGTSVRRPSRRRRASKGKAKYSRT